jgi:hypothetical protein
VCQEKGFGISVVLEEEFGGAEEEVVFGEGGEVLLYDELGELLRGGGLFADEGAIPVVFCAEVGVGDADAVALPAELDGLQYAEVADLFECAPVIKVLRLFLIIGFDTPYKMQLAQLQILHKLIHLTPKLTAQKPLNLIGITRQTPLLPLFPHHKHLPHNPQPPTSQHRLHIIPQQILILLPKQRRVILHLPRRMPDKKDIGGRRDVRLREVLVALVVEGDFGEERAFVGAGDRAPLVEEVEDGDGVGVEHVEEGLVVFELDGGEVGG